MEKLPLATFLMRLLNKNRHRTLNLITMAVQIIQSCIFREQIPEHASLKRNYHRFCLREISSGY